MVVTRRPWLDAFAAGLVLGLSAVFAAGLVRTPSGGGCPLSETVSAVSARREPVPKGARAAAFRSFKAFNEDRIPTASAAVTFYMLLALFPAMSAFVSLYGLVADVDVARRRVGTLRDVLPGDAIAVLGDQLTRLAGADHGALGAAFFVSLLVSVWTANAGVKALIGGLNTAYETRENRGLVRLNLISLGFTTGTLGLAVILIATVVESSRVLARFGVPGLVGGGAALWSALLLLSIVLISLLYRYAPARREGRWRWITVGSAMAAIVWMLMTVGFSWFVRSFGHFDRVYGSLGAIVGFMTWIWLSLMIVLAGAELNGALERQEPSAESVF